MLVACRLARRLAAVLLACEMSVSRNRSRGKPAVFRVQANRFDDEVEFIGAVVLARYAVGHAGPCELGFGEVIELVDPLRIAILHEEHGIRRETPARLGSAVVALAGGLLRPGYHPSAARHRSRRYCLPAGESGILGLRRLVPPNRKGSEFATSRSAMAIAMVVLKRMFPQSENGVFVVMFRGRDRKS